MRVFDRLSEVNHHHDRAQETIASLPQATVWGVAADVEYEREGQQVNLDGILSHDGEKLQFIAWSGRRVLDAALSDVIVMRQRNSRLQLKTQSMTVKFEPFFHLGEAVEFPPTYAADVSNEDPFAGLLSWIPSAASVL